MNSTFTPTDELPLPEGFTQEGLDEVFAELDALDAYESFMVLMEVTEDGSVYIPSPTDVRTPIDALKNIAKQSPIAVENAAGNALLVMLGCAPSIIAGRF